MSTTRRSNARIAKSFTGCARCKEKKKKCDETLPACRACQRANAVCPGYSQRLRWSRKHERFEQFGNRPRTSLTKARHDPRSSSSANEQDGIFSQSVSRAAGSPESLEPDVATVTDQDTLDLVFSQWLNAEFLPRDDLPLLGLNLPAGHTFGEYVGSLSTDSTPWPINDEFPVSIDGLDPYQNLQALSDSCDCSSGHENDCHCTREADWSSDHARDSNRGSCLETFYRMSTPNLRPRFSADHLIKHYFTEVCALISCFDSSLNPFRTLVAEEFKRSATVSLTIQSMSIAHLANHYLYMAPLGMAKRCQAWRSLQSDLQRQRTGQVPLETVLLSLLLLGSSASWHQPANLGLPYLYIMRTLMQGHFRRGRILKHQKFFADALMYWEMQASFLDPFPMRGFPGYGMPELRFPTDDRARVPHPWTGISTEIHLGLAEVGRILRRRQRMSDSPSESCEVDSIEVQERQWAIKLEAFLRSIPLQANQDLGDCRDKDTAKSDLLRIAHMQRYVGLLELWQAFPMVLKDIVSEEDGFPTLYDSNIGELSLLKKDTISPQSVLCAIATRILEISKSVSVISSACRFLPLIFVSCAYQLRLPPQPSGGDETQSEHQDQVIESRYFIESRMLELSTRYPQKQMLQILEIMKEVWDRLDNCQADNAHWMTVMHETELLTMLG